MASLQKSIRDQAKKEGEVNLKKADEFLDKNKAENPDIKELPLDYNIECSEKAMEIVLLLRTR